MHCSSCGANLPPHADFCPYCGTLVGGVETADPAPEPPPKPGPWGEKEGIHPRKAEQKTPWPEDASLGPDHALDDDADLQPDPEPKRRWWQRKKKRKPRSSLKEPPRRKMPGWQKAGVWIAALAILGAAVWGGTHLWQTRTAVKAVSTHLNAIMGRNLQAAYAMTASSYQKANTPQSFITFVRNSRALSQLAFYAVEDRDVKGDKGTLRFLLIDRAGTHTPAAYDIVKEGDDWRIYGIRLDDEAEKGPSPVPLIQTTTTPPEQKTQKPETTTETPDEKTTETSTTQTTETPTTQEPDSKAPGTGTGEDVEVELPDLKVTPPDDSGNTGVGGKIKK